MRLRRLSMIAVVAILAGCGSGAPSPTAAPTPMPTPTVAPTPSPSPTPTPSPSPVAADPFAGQPYTVVVPPGWRAFNLSDPSAKAGLEAYVAANPSMAAAIKLFESIPGVRMAVNPLLGNFMLIVTLPSGGTPLATIGQSFSSQFAAVPGIQGTPKAENVTLPGGPAIHWQLTVSSKMTTGATISVSESVYLLANATDAAILEFVTLSGGVIPDEAAIADSFAFKP
jgi:hypothetical protein